MYIPYMLALATEAPDGASSSEVSAARYLGDGNVGKRQRCVGGRPSTYGTHVIYVAHYTLADDIS